jgi:hypothetical protein
MGRGDKDGQMSNFIIRSRKAAEPASRFTGLLYYVVVVAQSTLEVEYNSHACETAWLRKLVAELGVFKTNHRIAES